MLNTLLLGLQFLGQHTKDLLTTILHNDFITTLVLAGLCLALLFLATGELAVASLLAVFLIMCLTVATGYLLITMRTSGWQAQVGVSVGIGVALGATVLLLLTAVSLLALSLLCMS